MRSSPSFTVLPGLSALAVGAALVVPAALGSPGGQIPATANLKLGKTLFVGICGSCHTLRAAGTKGRRGPSLDDEAPDYRDSVDQIRHGGGGMPALGSSLTRLQVDDIAAFVATATLRGSGGDD